MYLSSEDLSRNDYFVSDRLLPSILKTHFQEKSVVPAGSSPVILVMLEMR